MNKILHITCTLSFALCTVFGESLPAFEVASVRPFDRTGQVGHGSVEISGPQVTMTGYTLSALIQYAYDLRSYQISGGPDWIASDAFTIRAKVEGEASPAVAQIRKMLQSLLAERFDVKLHRETKESRVYLLEPAKTGSRLTQSTAARTTMRMGAGHLMMAKATIPQMAALLSSVLDRPVLDRTGIAGEFDFTLDSPEINTGRTQPQEQPSGPSIFTAVQEQLGLKLESSKGPIEALVIEHATKPEEN